MRKLSTAHVIVLKTSTVCRLSVSAFLALGLTLLAVGCGGSDDPLAISCSDYLAKDEATQLSLAGRWQAPDRDNPNSFDTNPGTERPTQQRLIGYCQQPDHQDDQLKDLEPSIG